MRIGTAVTACLLLGLSACQRQDSSPVAAAPAAPAAGACTLSVGWDPWEPYQYEDADGSMRGLDVEIVRQLATDAGCDTRFVRGNWKDLLAQVREGGVQVLLAATPTPERESYARFSTPYRRESFVLYTREADAAALGSLDLAQLVHAGRRIGVTDGYYYGEAVTALISDDATRAAFVFAPVVELNYTRLAGGEVDALLDDAFVAAALLRRKGIGDQLKRHPGEINTGEVSLMYSKKGVAEDLAKKLDAALAVRKSDGSLGRMIAKYQN